RTREISQALDASLRDANVDGPLGPRVSIGDAQVAVASARLGLHGEIGIIVAGSETGPFPAQTDQVLLAVAASQATIALQHARLRNEQRRRANEDALRNSERQFRLLVDAVPALVWRGTAEGDLDYLNQRAVVHLGHTPESLSNGRWLDLVHP